MDFFIRLIGKDKEQQVNKQKDYDQNQFIPLKSQQYQKSHINQNEQNVANQPQQNHQNKQNLEEDHMKSSKILPYQNKVSLQEQYPNLSKQFQNINKTQSEKKNHQIIDQKKEKEKFTDYIKKQYEKLQQFQNYLQNSKQKLNNSILRNQSYRSMSTSNVSYRPDLYNLNLSRVYVPNFKAIQNQSLKQDLTEQQIQTKLKQIYQHYAQTYLQPTQKFQTFDNVKKRVLNFQSFCLFAKDFKLLKIIYSLQTIKKVYKKYSDFGKTLKFSHFLNVIQALADEKDARQFFKIDQIVPSINNNMRKELMTQQLYNYLGIYENKKYKQKFTQIFKPFGCKQEVQLPKIKYNYKRFSEVQLHKKALPQPRQQKNKKRVIVIKNDQKYQPSPFQLASSIVVSWQMFKSKSVEKLQSLKKSSEVVKKKYVKQDPQDKVYLKEYNQKKSLQRKFLQKKIQQIQKNQNKKTNNILLRIDSRIRKSQLKI